MPPKPRKPPRRRKPPVSLKDEQLLALLQEAKKHRERDYVMILVTYWHGLRASEVVNLRESDIDLGDGKIRIQRGKGSEGGLHDLQKWPDNPLFDERVAIGNWLANRAQFGVKGGAKPRPGQIGKLHQKGAGGGRETRPGSALLPSDTGCDRRTVGPILAEKMQQSTQIVAFSRVPPVSPPVSPRIEAAPSEKPAGGSKGPPDPLNLASGQGNDGKWHSGEAGIPQPAPQDQNNEISCIQPKKLFSPTSPRLFPIHRCHVWKLVHGYMLAAGIPRYKCKTHTLKHTIAKHLVRAGVPINEIQEWMGWRSIETMNWYTRADEEELGQRIGDAIRGKLGLRQTVQGRLF